MERSEDINSPGTEIRSEAAGQGQEQQPGPAQAGSEYGTVVNNYNTYNYYGGGGQHQSGGGGGYNGYGPSMLTYSGVVRDMRGYQGNGSLASQVGELGVGVASFAVVGAIKAAAGVAKLAVSAATAPVYAAGVAAAGVNKLVKSEGLERSIKHNEMIEGRKETYQKLSQAHSQAEKQQGQGKGKQQTKGKVAAQAQAAKKPGQKKGSVMAGKGRQSAAGAKAKAAKMDRGR